MGKSIVSGFLGVPNTDQPQSVMVPWRLSETVPGNPHARIVKILVLDNTVKVFALPIKGSELESEFLKQLGGECGLTYDFPFEQVRLIEAFAPIADWRELLESAQARADELEEGIDPDDDDFEDEEEGEAPPLGSTGHPVPTHAAPFVPSMEHVVPSSPNGQTSGT
jgi:hypothetical protein